MALAFQLARFQNLHGDSRNPLEESQDARFEHHITKGETGHVVQAAIQYFDLEYYVNSNPSEHSLGREQVKCEITSVSGQSATVKVSVLLRPRDPGTNFTFKTSVIVLVIADVSAERSI